MRAAVVSVGGWAGGKEAWATSWGEENVLCSRIRVMGTSVYTFAKIHPTLD